jgi:hypothetical protein
LESAAVGIGGVVDSDDAAVAEDGEFFAEGDVCYGDFVDEARFLFRVVH